MKSFVLIITKKIFIIFILLSLTFNIFSCSDSSGKSFLYDGEFLEKKLAIPYNIEGILIQNGEKYDVIIENTANNSIESDIIKNGEFRIKFMSGDVTEGLTVEFFDNGVFLFFDDLRFKTNSEIFTNLEALKTAFEILSAPYIEKYVTNTAPADGIDNNILEIGVQNENGNIKAYINKIDGSIIKLTENLNGTDIILDIKKFENIIEPFTKNPDNDSDEVDYDVVDDYIYT